MGDDSGKVCICILIVLALGGAGTGAYYGLRKSQITPTSPVILIPLKDGHYAMGQYELTDTQQNGTSTSTKLILTQVVYDKPPAHVTSEDKSEYKIHSTLPDSGYRFSFDKQMQLTVQLDVETLSQHLVSTVPAVRAVAQSIPVEAAVLNQTEAILKLENDLALAFSRELNTSGGFRFKKSPMVELIFNSSESRYKVAKNPLSQSSNNRRLLARRILFLNLIFDFIASSVEQIALPVVNLIRDHGPLIGKIAGGLVGGALGGYEGFSQGIEIGERIGLAAQSFFKACVPSDKLTIKCTQEGIIQSLSEFGTDFITDLILPELDEATCGPIKCNDLISFASDPIFIDQ